MSQGQRSITNNNHSTVPPYSIQSGFESNDSRFLNHVKEHIHDNNLSWQQSVKMSSNILFKNQEKQITKTKTRILGLAPAAALSESTTRAYSLPWMISERCFVIISFLLARTLASSFLRWNGGIIKAHDYNRYENTTCSNNTSRVPLFIKERNTTPWSEEEYLSKCTELAKYIKGIYIVNIRSMQIT